jgi:hypothetical protein
VGPSCYSFFHLRLVSLPNLNPNMRHNIWFSWEREKERDSSQIISHMYWSAQILHPLQASLN